MQTIFKANQTANFYQGLNAIAQDGSLSDRAARILQYAISLPADWRIIPRQLMKHFGWGRDSVYKALKELRKRGYAALVRCRRAAEWYIFNTPQTPETLATFTTSKQPEATSGEAFKNPDFKNPTIQDALQNTNHEKKNEETTTPCSKVDLYQSGTGERTLNVVACREIDESNNDCIGSIDGIEGADEKEVIPHIESKHQTTARQALRTLTKAEADAVLTVLTMAMSKGAVSNPIGYLLQLVKTSKTGTFSPVQSAGGAPIETAAQRIEREQQRQQEAAARGRMTTKQHATWLAETYGEKASKVSKTGGRVGLRAALGW